MTIPAAIDAILKMVNRRVDRVTPFRATVTAVDGNLVEIRRVGAATPDSRKYASCARFVLHVGDVVLCANLDGEPVVIDRISISPAATPTFTKLAQAGSTGSTAGSVGSDTIGMIQVVPGGTGITSGGQVSVTFAAARPNNTYGIWLQPLTSAARAAGSNVGVTSRASAGWTLTSDVPLTGGATYSWFYRLEHLPV